MTLTWDENSKALSIEFTAPEWSIVRADTATTNLVEKVLAGYLQSCQQTQAEQQREQVKTFIEAASPDQREAVLAKITEVRESAVEAEVGVLEPVRGRRG